LKRAIRRRLTARRVQWPPCSAAEELATSGLSTTSPASLAPRCAQACTLPQAVLPRHVSHDRRDWVPPTRATKRKNRPGYPSRQTPLLVTTLYVSQVQQTIKQSNGANRITKVHTPFTERQEGCCLPAPSPRTKLLDMPDMNARLLASRPWGTVSHKILSEAPGTPGSRRLPSQLSKCATSFLSLATRQKAMQQCRQRDQQQRNARQPLQKTNGVARPRSPRKARGDEDIHEMGPQTQ
jgi:hypothetical protein